MAFDDLLTSLAADFGHVTACAGQHFSWSPATQEVIYRTGTEAPTDLWSLLHEFGHAALGHKTYHSDFELVRLEVAAWQKAKQLATGYGLTISEEHVQNCLDTYRDWLHRRSLCPTCGCQSLQRDNQPVYECFNCHTTWRVSASRFCRPYRQTKALQTAAATDTVNFS